MGNSILDLIIHPVRLQIVQLLSVRQMTTQEISSALPDVATSSLYRHLKQLLDSGMIAVADRNQVRGIEEKVYTLAQSPHISDPAVFMELTREEHLRYFVMYAAALIQGFSNYVHHTPELNPFTDRVGYTEGLVWATPEQIDDLGKTINTALLTLMQQGPGEGRTLRKVGLVLHPIFLPSEGNGGTDETPEEDHS